VWVGKTRDKNYKALQDDYLRRLSHFVKCEIVELRDGPSADRKNAEGEAILAKIDRTSHVCLLDVTGKQASSHGLAEKVEVWQSSAVKDIVFVIGGSDGVSEAVAERADNVLSLSILTFTHEMARVILLEQLYRAFTIIKGYPYQK
jgi:23S rRNA (pseudouridine1915-N3)-methyltransferase